jgi:hypothetical protein
LYPKSTIKHPQFDSVLESYHEDHEEHEARKLKKLNFVQLRALRGANQGKLKPQRHEGPQDHKEKHF